MLKFYVLVPPHVHKFSISQIVLYYNPGVRVSYVNNLRGNKHSLEEFHCSLAILYRKPFLLLSSTLCVALYDGYIVFKSQLLYFQLEEYKMSPFLM